MLPGGDRQVLWMSTTGYFALGTMWASATTVEFGR